MGFEEEKIKEEEDDQDNSNNVNDLIKELKNLMIYIKMV